MQGANTVYQIHAIVAWAFWALFPFSRLVHAFSIPLQYVGRPYILYRRRYAPDFSARDEPRHRHRAGAGHVRSRSALRLEPARPLAPDIQEELGLSDFQTSG